MKFGIPYPKFGIWIKIFPLITYIIVLICIEINMSISFIIITSGMSFFIGVMIAIIIRKREEK